MSREISCCCCRGYNDDDHDDHDDDDDHDDHDDGDRDDLSSSLTLLSSSYFVSEKTPFDSRHLVPGGEIRTNETRHF